MSALTRVIVAEYRCRISRRPDGEVHLKDPGGVTHRVTNHDFVTACGMGLAQDDGDYRFVLASSVDRPTSCNLTMQPTWDDVDCMTCLVENDS